MSARTSIGKLIVASLATAFFVTLRTAPVLGQTLTIGLASGAPGTSVWFDVTLDPQGKSIAATQNDIGFNSVNTPIATCVKNDALAKDLSLNSLPNGCSGTACTIACTNCSTRPKSGRAGARRRRP